MKRSGRRQVRDDRLSRGRSVGGTQFPAHPSMPGWYADLLSSVATRIASGQRNAVAAVNHEILATGDRRAVR